MGREPQPPVDRGDLRHGRLETTNKGSGARTTRPFLVMEYVDGQTLRQKLSQHPQFAPAQAIEVAEGVLDALAYAHGKGAVHRDIKPANVKITGTGHVKVMGFGVATLGSDPAAAP